MDLWYKDVSILLLYISMSDTTIDQIQDAYLTIIQKVGENPEREGLLNTPRRAAEAMQYLTKGYEQSLEEVTNSAIFSSDCDQMVLINDIELYSMCEHHLLPFVGKCHIAYLPDGKVLGLSKFARIVDMYSRRLQIQETLTCEIALAVEKVTGAHGVAVVIEAKHMCMMMRGVEKQNSSMRTSSLLGVFRDSVKTRAEFFSLLNS